MKNLQAKHGATYLSIADHRGNICPFFGGVFTPADEEQREFLLKCYGSIIEDATEAAGEPATIAEYKDFQAAQNTAQLDISQNVSESAKCDLKPANSLTMQAVVAGITPVQAAAPKTVAVTTKVAAK